MRTRIKRLVLISVTTVVGFFFITFSISFFVSKYNDYIWYKKTDNFMSALQAPFKADVYGGKTPEETWAMYNAAVNSGDIEKASKFIDVNHQHDELAFLQRARDRDGLKAYSAQINNVLEKNNDIPDWLAKDKTRAYFRVRYPSALKPGTIVVRDVNFYLNPLTGVWKILY